MKFGKIRKLVNGQDFCVLTYGPITKIYEIKNSLKEKIKVHPYIACIQLQNL